MASITTRVTPRSASQSDITSNDRVIVEKVRTSCMPAPARAGHPHAADQLGLADVQRRDPLDDLLIVLLDVHHSHHLRREPRQTGRP